MNEKNLLETAEITDEKLTCAIIVRGDAHDIKKLKDMVLGSNMKIVFKKLSTDNLYCINHAEYTQFMKIKK